MTRSPSCFDDSRIGRLARIVVPGLPYHVTQRGNGRQTTFFEDADYAFSQRCLAESCRAAGVEVWAWCLMPEPVHLLLVPPDKDGLRRALAPVHRRYAGHIHARQKRTGHFWQGRYGAVALDEDHVITALRYIALNPVRAGLVPAAADWPWASTRAQLEGRDDGLTARAPVSRRVPAFADLLALGPEEAGFERLRRGESVGRPLGSESFLRQLEAATGRLLRPGRRGPKRKKERQE